MREQPLACEHCANHLRSGRQRPPGRALNRGLYTGGDDEVAHAGDSFRAEQPAVLRPYVATVVVACPPGALTGALRDIVADASLIRNALDYALLDAAPPRSIVANRAETAAWELAVATVRASGLEIGVAYGARGLPDAMHRAGRAASALITVLAEHDIAAADSGTVSVTPMEAR